MGTPHMLLNNFQQLCCIFCGDRIVRKYNCSATDLGAVQDFLSARCVRTSFHYGVIMEMKGSKKVVGFCSSCRGWQRRVQHSGRRQKHYTPVDHVISVVLSPGSAPDMDQRNWHQIADNLLHGENLFGDLLPVSARSILTEMLQSPPTADHREVLARAWYKYNERPEFFHCGKLASIVKRFALGSEDNKHVGCCWGCR